MCLIDEVKKLRELEQRGKKNLRIATIEPHISSSFRKMSPNEYGATVVDTGDSIGAFGEDVAAFGNRAEAERYVLTSNLAPAMLEVLGGFREGDASRLDSLLKFPSSSIVYPDEIEMLCRLQCIAARMEKEEQ